MGALVCALAVSAVSAQYHRSQRALFEVAAERTAIGDRVYFPLHNGPTLRFESELLVPAKEPEPFAESRMYIAGIADGVPYKLYVPVERVGAPVGTGGPSWWVKTGPGQFLRMGR
jgi:hypothetical protein